MPRIQELLPEQNAAGPMGAESPNIEQVSAAGRGVEAFGRDMGQASDVVYQRQTQMEQSDAFSTVSQARSDMTDEMQKSINDGTFDVDKFKQKFQDWQSDLLDNFETAGGKNAANRYSSRLFGSLLQKGIKGQALIAHNNAISGFNDGLNDLASSVRQDPDQFDDAYSTVLENSQHMQDSGAVGAKDAPAIEDHAANVLAREAVLGTANRDPQKALKMLQDPDFANNLNPQTQDELQTKVRQAQLFKDGDEARMQAIKEKSEKAQQEKWMTNNASDIASGKISPMDVLLKSPIKEWDVNLAAAEKAKQAQALVQYTSPQVMRDVQDRLLLPKDDPNAITSISQLYQEKELSPNDVSKLSKWYLTTPQGAAQKQQEQLMMNDIKGKLKVNGIPDPDYNNRVINAVADFQKQQQQMVSEGKDPSTLTDPTSKNYFAASVRPASPMELMQQQAARMTGAPQPSPMIIHTTPGVIPPRYKVGDVVKGYTYMGGDEKAQASWKQVAPAYEESNVANDLKNTVLEAQRKAQIEVDQNKAEAAASAATDAKNAAAHAEYLKRLKKETGLEGE